MNREDEFEKRLERQPWRSVPSAWREQILAAARKTVASDDPTPLTRGSWFSSLRPVLSRWLWPAPKAWAGLAAAWLLVFILNFAAREPSLRETAEQAAPPSPQMRQLLRQQEQLLVELVDPFGSQEPRLPERSAPQPRSQRREPWVNA